MTWWKLVLVGFVRHIIGIIGAWLVAHDFLPADVIGKWSEEAVGEIVGWILIVAALALSAFDKKKVLDWLRRALRLSPQSERAAAPEISKMVTK